MLEQQLQKKIIKYLQSQGAYVVKVVTATRAGVPDILACYKGIFIAIEVKAPRKLSTVSELQRHNLELIEKAGGYTLLTDSFEAVKGFIYYLNCGGLIPVIADNALNPYL